MPDPLTLTPLLDVSPDAISEIFLADPSTLPDDKLDFLVKELRRRRSDYQSAQAAVAAKGKKGQSEPKPPKPTATEAAKLDKPAGEIELGDLL